ncbi:MAG TPA: DUF2516 family protein [Nocardioidaceae bacterium]|nr:DUF2516 family protein [Nocardioidaceae bacterium]
MAAFDSSIVFQIENQIKTAIWVIFFVIKLFALCDAAVRPNALFVAADKQTKLLWMVMLGVALLVHVVDQGFGLLALIGAVVALVYLADVRPMLRSMHRR